MTKAKNSKLSQEMIDAYSIVIAKQKIASLGLDPEDIMPKLQEKMGQYACTFVNEAMYPGYLCNRTGEPFQKSRALIQTYANETISDERLARALGAKNKKEVIAQTVKIQEAVAKYRVEKDLAALPSADVVRFQDIALEKQQQAELRITRRENKEAPKSAVLKITERTDSQTPEKETATVSTLEPIKEESVAATPSKFPFKFEPVNSAPAPWLKQTQTAEATPVQAASEQKVEGNGTPMDPIREKAREELARLKAGKNGELSLNELSDAGISPQDMEKVYTKDRLAEIHAGPQGQALGKKAKQIDAQRRTVGKCAGAAGDSIRATTGYTYQAETEGVVKYRVGKKTKFSKNNGTTQTRAIRKADEFYAFDFESNKQQGNPEIATLTQSGTYIGWEAKANATQPLGHAAIMGPDGNWHCDITQSPEYMSSNKPAKRYQSDTYTIAFLGDSTASDKLAEDMIYQKLVREERNKQLAQSRTQNDVERS